MVSARRRKNSASPSFPLLAETTARLPRASATRACCWPRARSRMASWARPSSSAPATSPRSRRSAPRLPSTVASSRASGPKAARFSAAAASSRSAPAPVRRARAAPRPDRSGWSRRGILLPQGRLRDPRACSSSARARFRSPRLRWSAARLFSVSATSGWGGPDRRLPALQRRLEQLAGGVLLPRGEPRCPEVVLGEGDGELVAGRGRPPRGQDLLEDLHRRGVPARRGRGERAGPRRRFGGDRLSAPARRGAATRPRAAPPRPGCSADRASR
jgi:hypothetical protein